MKPDPPGLDLPRLTDWFATAVPGAGGDLRARLVPGGKSNLTYEVSDGVAIWIVRRPPLGHVLATAHDMAREYRVMSALQDTAVPVPTTYALCEETDVLGAPFYVMERVTGTPYRHAAELEPLGPERTRVISTGLVDTLATLHEVDPTAVRLADFGRPEGFLTRQVRRWNKQLTASYCRDRPAAVIDWEMATVGDPLTDLALLVFYQRLGTLVGGRAVADAASAPGFLTEDEIVEGYAARSGRDLSRFGFYLGLAAYKLAAILEGIHYRHLHGQTVGPGFEHVADAIHPLLDAGLAALKEHR